MKIKVRTRLSQTRWIGPVRVRTTEPIGRGQWRVTAGGHTPLGWLSTLVQADTRKPRRRS